ncbi:50S ribosomal protein L24 [Candidatus Campbellbacteria bacterium]|nr:50S ribosomal protein L24 [Candidatus Campbellbacteria bacterium]|tara:strand:- start:786 stop:1094 length:309 start_codon:yes stop_codon:yes gene_type:complete
MKIKVGDTVIVTSGSRADRNKQGKVLKTFPESNTVVVEGVNLKKKVTREPNGTKAQVDVEFPIHVSNVMIYDEKAGKGSRVSVAKDGKNKTRTLKASGTELK